MVSIVDRTSEVNADAVDVHTEYECIWDNGFHSWAPAKCVFEEFPDPLEAYIRGLGSLDADNWCIEGVDTNLTTGFAN